MNLPKFNLPTTNWVVVIKKTLLFLLIVIISGAIAAFLTGFVSALSSNIQISGITGQLSFDPLITIAYIILFHYTAHFANLSKSIAAKFFLLTLFLSFTTNFIPGSLFLLTLIYLTHKLFLKTDKA